MDAEARILHVVPRIVLRGAEVFAAQLAEALQPVSRNLLFPLFGPEEGRPAAAVRVVPGARPRQRVERLTGVDPGALARMRLGLRRLRPDLVVAHGSEPLKYLSFADPRSRVPVVYRRISHAVGGPGEAVLRRLFGRASLILAVSGGLRDELVRDLGVDPGLITVLPTSRKPPPSPTPEARASLRAEIGGDPDRPLVVWVGRMSPEKQPGVALQAFALLRSRFGPCTFAMCGDGPLREAVSYAAESAGDGVRVLGSREDAGAIIAAADLLVSSSRIEGAPGVLVEAGLAGTPVVAFDVGEVASIVRHGETGLLVTPGDAEALAEAARRLLERPELRSRMSAAAPTVCAQFALESIAGRYAEAFGELLGPEGDGLRRMASATAPPEPGRPAADEDPREMTHPPFPPDT
ncbi:MAG TPA: glycosyltransferase family 4 protein [Actinomycetota bacterium]|jgi:glycosyltransferase involved in cell wall biosynthesis